MINTYYLKELYDKYGGMTLFIIELTKILKSIMAATEK